jgi:hypothetical protein
MRTTSVIMFFLFTCVFTMYGQSNPGKSKKTLRHVVLVKFKDSSAKQEVDNVIKEFGMLKKPIKQIKDFEWGVNNSPENLNEGLTHAFTLTFASEKDRDDYLVHPSHKKFVDIAGPHIDKVVVVDYWVE